MMLPNSVLKKIAEMLVRRRWILFVVVLLLTTVLSTLARGLHFDGSVDVWFAENDPAQLRRDTFQKVFGNQHSVLILLEPDDGVDLFSPAKAETLYTMVRRLEQKTPFLKQVLWVGDVEIVEPEGDGILISRLLDHAPPFSADETFKARKRALAEPDFINRYISEDGRALAVLIDLNHYPIKEKSPGIQVAKAVAKTLEETNLDGVQVSVVGEPVFMAGYTALAAQQTPMLFGLCLLVQLAMLALLTRTVASTFTPLFIVLLSVAWTFGFIGLAGYDLNLMIIGLPIILVCVCVGDAVHLITAFSTNFHAGMMRREAMVQAVEKTFWPCLLTTLTTAAGFFSFIAAPMRPFQQMAFYVPAGILAAFVLTFVLVPCFYLIGKKNPSLPKVKMGSTPRNNRTDAFFNFLANFVIENPRKIAVSFILLCLIGAAGAYFVRIESNNNRLMTSEVPLRQAIDRVDAAMGGSMAIDIMLDSGMPDGIKHADFIERMEKLESFIAQHPLVVNTTSVLEPIKKTRAAVYGASSTEGMLPQTDQEVVEYLFLYEMAGGNQLDRLVSFDSSMARINARTSSLGTEEGKQLRNDIQKAAQRIMSPDTTVTMSGSIDLTVALNKNVAKGQNTSFALALVFICLLMMLVARSVKMGLISMVPNVVPVLMVLGLLGVTGIYMDTVLMTVSAMILGVATDDTIHFFLRLREEFLRTGRYDKAVRNALLGIGRPLLFTTITLSAGFSVLATSVMVGWIKIGLLSGYAFTWALIADFMFFPALFILVRPFGEERTIATNGE